MTTNEGSPTRRNYPRRFLGTAVCLSPVLLLGVSLAVGLCRVEETGQEWIRAVAAAVLCLPVPILNFYLDLIRPRIYGARVGYRNISGIPVFGTLLVVVCGWATFGDWCAAAAGLAALALDTGGAPWFLIATWRDGSLWDE